MTTRLAAIVTLPMSSPFSGFCSLGDFLARWPASGVHSGEVCACISFPIASPYCSAGVSGSFRHRFAIISDKFWTLRTSPPICHPSPSAMPSRHRHPRLNPTTHVPYCFMLWLSLSSPYKHTSNTLKETKLNLKINLERNDASLILPLRE